MTGDPLVRARERVAEELERTQEKRRALDRFEADIRSISVASTGRPDAGGGVVATRSEESDGRRQVRQAFEEHVQPLSGDALETPETVHQAIATEFSRDVAVALATTEATGLPSRLKRAVLDESERRRAELRLTERALEGERGSLAEACDALEEVRGWLDSRAETRLSTRGFDVLAEWHGRLEAHRETLDRVAARRQRYLDRTTATEVTVAVSHRTLVEYLYAEHPSTYPVLGACASLAATCRTAQRRLRTHLVRSV